MQVIKQRYWKNPQVQLAWRPIEPYCVQKIPYYDLTSHYAGSAGEGYNVRDLSNAQAQYLQRRKADGTIRESEQPNYTKFQNYLENDIVASTIPLHKIHTLYLRKQNVKSLLFVPSIHTPQMRGLFLRSNWIVFDNLDFRNCVHIDRIDTSMCYLGGIQLPPTGPNDTNNYFKYCYIGHYDPVRGVDGWSPPEVIDALIERAYFSRESYAAASSTGARYKQFATAPNNGHLYHGPNKTLPYHQILARDRNWDIAHLSIETFNLSFTKSGQVRSFDLYNSTNSHEIHVHFNNNPDWISLDKNYFYPDKQNIQTMNITVQENTTGAPRSTTIVFRKLKTYDYRNEMDYSAKVTVTQAG